MRADPDKNRPIDEGQLMESFPNMIRVRQNFTVQRVDDIQTTVHEQLSRLNLDQKVSAGQTVAITAGSRGIANIAEITRAIVSFFQALGAVPFVVPAMGSHGGGTAEGQRDILAGYGITPAGVGCEIRSSMETVVVDETPHGIPVHFDRHAYEADHVVVAGRVKAHTGFVGPIESGLHKMMLIGLGKHAGAKIYHRAITDLSFMEIITAVAGVVLEKCSVLAGVAIVENAYDDTALIEAVAPADFLERETQLLKQANAWMPSLPFPEIDVLIVDQIGKNISGSGMDTNIIGRKYNDHKGTELDAVSCKRIHVRGLTEETHGNACGIGLAEFTTRACAESVDADITRINCITGGHPTAGAIPLVYDNDREAISAALQCVGLVSPERARVVHIRDTLHLSELMVSEAFSEQIEASELLSIEEAAQPMPFDSDGNLIPVSRPHNGPPS